VVNKKTRSTIQTTTWKKIRDRVSKVNPDFAAAVDSVSPNDSYELYSVKYPFGSMIFDTAVLNLPNSANQLVPLTHHTIPAKLKEQLSYRTIPMGMMLSKESELHTKTGNYLIPLTIFSEGSLFGVWETFDPLNSFLIKLSWNVSSGARSLFMLPKITERSGYQRLQKEFGVRIKAPARLKDHWKVFAELTQSQNFPTSWDSEVLFFSKKWFDQLQKKNAWPTLQNYLYKTVWQQSMFWRFLVTFNLIWHQFSLTIKNNRARWGSYQLETLKHLITIGLGGLPSFTPSDNAEKLAPTKTLQDIFLGCYGLNYVPTIMLPHHFSLKSNKFAYYSINEPALIEGMPKTREVSNIMRITKDVKILFDDLRQELEKDAPLKWNLPICELATKVTFDFFHTIPDTTGLLQIPQCLPKDDPVLMTMPDKYAIRPFCESSVFLKGLVRMGRNKTS